MENTPCRDTVYRMVQERIIHELENGRVPWHSPHYGAQAPVNYVSGKPYRGINLMLLPPGEYVTLKQAQRLGGKIRKGAHGVPVFFFSPYEKKVTDPETGEEKTETRFTYKFYRAFHLRDTEGLPPRLGEYVPPRDPASEGRRIVASYAALSGVDASRTTDGQASFYDPEADRITLAAGAFRDPRSAGTPETSTFAALASSTGKAGRLSRKGYDSPDPGSREFIREQMVVEMASAMLLNIAGYNSEEAFHDSADYIRRCIEALRCDVRLAVVAASRAEKAARFVLDDDPDLITLDEDEAVTAAA